MRVAGRPFPSNVGRIMFVRKSLLAAVALCGVGGMLATRPGRATAAELSPGDRVVAVGRTSLRAGEEEMFAVEDGTEMLVVAIGNGWIGVRVEHGGRMVSGWIDARHVAREGAEPASWEESLPAGTRERVTAQKRAAFYRGELESRSELSEQGHLAEGDVEDVGVDLAVARYNMYLSQGKRRQAAAELNVVVLLYQRELERLVKLAESGAVPEGKVDNARRRLACARHEVAAAAGRRDDALAQLAMVVAVCEREVERLEKLGARRIVPEAEVDEGRRRLALARYTLAREKDEPEVAAEQLRIIASTWKRALERTEKLHQSGAAAKLEVNLARWGMAEARLRLGIVYGKGEVVVEELRTIVALHEARLEMIRETNRLGGYASAAVKEDWEVSTRWQLASDRRRLEQALAGIYRDSNPLGELLLGGR